MRNDNLEKILSYLQNVQETKVIQAIKEELLQYGDGALGFMLKFMAVSATEEERTAEQNLDLIKEAIE